MKKGVFIIFSIPIFLNLGEILNPTLDQNSTNLLFIILYFLVLLPTFIFSKGNKLNRDEVKPFVLIRLTFLSIIFLIPFFWFLIKNNQNFSFVDYVIFMENYRNGVFKGSGLYTFGATNIFPFLYCFSLFHFKIPRKINFFFLAVVILPSLLLGLRVWLIPIFIIFTIVIFSDQLNFKKILFYPIIILSLILSTKIILAPDIYLADFKYTLFKILSRTNYQALIVNSKPDFSLFWKFIETFNVYDVKDYFYFKNQSHIEKLYEHKLIHRAGLAIPLTVYLINVFGYITGMILIGFFLIFITLNFRIANDSSKSIMFRSFNLLLGIIITAMLVEDILFVNKIILLPFLSLLIHSTLIEKPFRI